MNELLLKHLTASQLILDLIAVSLVIGAVDWFRKNKWGLGRRFEEGLAAFPIMFIMMGGILVLVPLIGKFLYPAAAPVLRFFGADPGMFAGMVLACDMGGFPLAHELSGSNGMAGDFSGLILGSILGVNIVSSIPVSLEMTAKADHPYLAKGFLYGFITVPVGGFCGGLMAGYPFAFLLVQMIPVLIASALIALLLSLIPEKLMKAFLAFGRFMTLLAVLGAAAASAAYLFGIPTAPYLDSIQSGMQTVCSVILILPGAYVLVAIVSRCFRGVFLKAGKLIGINEYSAVGLVTSLANALPTLGIIKDMDPKGKLVNFAFITSGSYVLGDHLGFCAAVAPKLILPVLTAKLSAGIAAVALALLLNRTSNQTGAVKHEEGKGERVRNG